jgi:hypothetical protein
MHTIVLFALLYGCSIPVTIIFALCNLVFLFYTTKYTFIKYGAKPMRMGHSLSRVSVNILLIGVVIHCLMAPIFLGAKGIGEDNSHYFYTHIHPNTNLTEDSLTVGQRFQKFGPFYLTVAALVIVYMSCRKVFLEHILTRIRKFVASVAGRGLNTITLSGMMK